MDISLIEAIEPLIVRQTHLYGHFFDDKFALDDVEKLADENRRSKELLSRAVDMCNGRKDSESRLMRIMHEIVSIELELYERMAKEALFHQYSLYRKKIAGLMDIACDIRSEIQAGTIISHLHNGYDVIVTITGLEHIGEFISELKSRANSAYSSASKEVLATDYFQDSISKIMLADPDIKKVEFL